MKNLLVLNDDDYEHYKLQKINTNFKKLTRENYLKSSKEKLKETIYKRMQTNMIGGLSRFEKKFGYLWGHGQDIDGLSDKERDFRIYWEELRNEYLTFSNNNIRECLAGLDEFKIEWNRYKVDFVLKNRGNNG